MWTESYRTNESKLTHFSDNFDLEFPDRRFEPSQGEIRKNLLEKIRKHYFGDSTTISLENYDNFLTMLSDTVFAYGIDKTIRSMESQVNGFKTFYYRYDELQRTFNELATNSLVRSLIRQGVLTQFEIEALTSFLTVYIFAIFYSVKIS